MKRTELYPLTDEKTKAQKGAGTSVIPPSGKRSMWELFVLSLRPPGLPALKVIFSFQCFVLRGRSFWGECVELPLSSVGHLSQFSPTESPQRAQCQTNSQVLRSRGRLQRGRFCMLARSHSSRTDLRRQWLRGGLGGTCSSLGSWNPRSGAVLMGTCWLTPPCCEGVF